MYKILHIIPGSAGYGGIENVVYNYYNNIDRSRFHFDFTINAKEPGYNGKRLISLGAKYYSLPLATKGLNAYHKALYSILKNGHYEAVHAHKNEVSYISLEVAKELGIKCRVAHSHTTAPFTSLKFELYRQSGLILNNIFATSMIGCGQLAGERVFGKFGMKRENAYVLPNAIETSKFSFNQVVRDEVRSELGLQRNYVIGSLGRLSPEKNHAFTLRFIKTAHCRFPELKLLIVGDGEEQKKIKDFIRQNNMESYVKLLGRRFDVERLYQAFDCLVLPSIHEGFPVVAVEAMSSGLPVLLSDTITRELSFGSGVRYLSIKSVASWVETIGNLINNEKTEKRILRQNEPKDNGFDIRDTSKILEDIYMKDLHG